MPNRFFVVNHPKLTHAELPEHQIRGRETEGWEIIIIPSSAAPVVGVIANSFKNQADMLSFVGDAEGVTLVPIVDDVLGSRARKAIRHVGDEAAKTEGLDLTEASEHLDPKRSLSQLPLDSLFLIGRPVSTRQELAITGVPPSL